LDIHCVYGNLTTQLVSKLGIKNKAINKLIAENFQQLFSSVCSPLRAIN